MALNIQSHRGRDLPISQIKLLIDQILRGHQPITYSGHVKQRMREREFSTQDIQYLLETGNYTKGFWDAVEQNHEFNVAGFDLNGEELELSFAIDISPPCLTVVTGKREKP
jgi:hypothetical protein